MARKKPVMAEKDDTELIRNYDVWPCWPFLPIKRRSRSLEEKDLGVLVATREHADAVNGLPGSKVVVYHGYMFDWPKTPEAVRALPTTEYNSIAELVAGGWVVD